MFVLDMVLFYYMKDVLAAWQYLLNKGIVMYCDL